MAGLGPEPVTTLINTHWHFDHANGNEWLHELGPRIVAHENTRKHLAMMQRVEDWEFDFQPLSVAALPTDLFATERTLKLNNTTMELKYYGPAHTDSDIGVRFAEVDVLHTGDTFWNGIYPFIDYSTGGSIDGSIRRRRTRRRTPTLPRRPTRPSSSPGTDSRSAIGLQLQDFRDMLVGIRENVATLKRQGRSMDEIVAAKPTAA